MVVLNLTLRNLFATLSKNGNRFAYSKNSVLKSQVPKVWQIQKKNLLSKYIKGRNVVEDLSDWKPCKPPQWIIYEGQYVILEPLDSKLHKEQLYEVSSGEDAKIRMKYLWEEPESMERFENWLALAEKKDDPMFYAVIDKQTLKVGGRQCLMNIVPNHGVVEIGNIYWGPLISRRPAATEAVYLFGKHIFDDLGYRRWEWKCNNDDFVCKRAAERFGFKHEGVFRQHLVMKGASRDTSIYSVIDKEWKDIREGMEKWLNPNNFDENGIQIRRLEELRCGTYD